MPDIHSIQIPEALINPQRLKGSLRREVSGEVRFDAGSRALYATDGSNYRQLPIGVVIPRTIEDVIATVSIARENHTPLLSRGAGTSLAGQCCNTAIVLDFSKYLNNIIEIDPEKRLARVQPGVVLDDLRNAAERYGLTFGPDPATHKWCTLGGMIGNNSCGVHSVMAGRTVDNLAALDVLLYDGTRLMVGKGITDRVQHPSNERERLVYKRLQTLVDTYGDEIRRMFPQIPRRVSGYGIDQLLPENGFHVARSLVGSEGTLATLLEATVELIPSPRKRVLLVTAYDDMATAADLVPSILENRPIGLEAIDSKLTDAMRKKGLNSRGLRLLPTGDAWLLTEFGADTLEEAQNAAQKTSDQLLRTGLVRDSKIFADAIEQKIIWSVRDSALGAISRTPGEPDNWEGWEDAAVSPEKIGPYLRDFQKLLSKYNYHGALYGHIGDGCLHNRLDWDPKSRAGIDKWLAFTDEAADLVIRYGGSLSGEHGDGQARGALLPKMFGPRIMQAFEEFKTIWDPDWMMNPGKLIRPYRIDENLHYGANYKPPILTTYFDFPEDNGSFVRATERCVGAGVCRKEDGLMCPSYMATRDEKHVTRGRTHLLWEMMNGEAITTGWKSEEVREALDLCLACKGCKGECPVHVDLATYKAEFLAHYYKGRLRPRAAYTMGLISSAARIASLAPSLINMLTHAPITGAIAKKLAGIHPNRKIPHFARQTFKQWYFSNHNSNTRASKSHTGDPYEGFPPPVILWADTFNNYFRPETAIAATKVLEDAGFEVRVHKRTMCCGRPLYDWGLLDKAKQHLIEIMSVLKEDILAGTPIVVLEPSCASVFRDELINLFSRREDAKRLNENVYLLSEFLEKFAPDFARSTLAGKKALVQMHCHHQAVLGKEHESSILNRSKIDADILDAGCCGMAGAFGFQIDHYDLSMQIGERKLLPKIRETDTGNIIIADGFSCREQIEQATGRKTFHLAEVLADRVLN